MPFTISHAAAALPIHALSRTRLPLAALMIGCMAPDFAYFLPWDLPRVETHSLAGLWSFCLPVSLPLWLCYVRILEEPTLASLPESWRTRLARSAPLNLRTLCLASIAILSGSLTHLVWDAFTHASTPVVDVLPVLRGTLFEMDGIGVPLYFVLQVASSVAGLLALFVRARKLRGLPPLPREAQVAEMDPAVTDFERVLAVLLVVTAACAGGFFNVALNEGFVGHSALFHLLIGGMSGAAIAWSVLAVALRIRARKWGLFPQPNAD